MRYLDSLETLYAYYPDLASAGPTDEQLRELVEIAEDMVDADLEELGFKVPITTERGISQVKRLVVLRVLADILSVKLPAIDSNPSYAQYFEQRYHDELYKISKNPMRLGSAARRGAPGIPVTGSLLPQRRTGQQRASLAERVRRWLELQE